MLVLPTSFITRPTYIVPIRKVGINVETPVGFLSDNPSKRGGNSVRKLVLENLRLFTVLVTSNGVVVVGGSVTTGKKNKGLRKVKGFRGQVSMGLSIEVWTEVGIVLT